MPAQDRESPDAKTKALANLFDDWRKHWERRGLPVRRFVEDGPVFPEDYWALPARKRILFVLKETNEWFKRSDRSPEGRSIVRKTRAAIERGENEGWARLRTWAAMLSHQEYSQQIEKKREVWAHVAILNLKKEDGGPTCLELPLNWYALADKTLILEEIEILEPTILVLGGVTLPALWILDMPFDDVNNPVLANGVSRRWWRGAKHRVYICMPHPSYPRDNGVNRLRDVIKEAGL